MSTVLSRSRRGGSVKCRGALTRIAITIAGLALVGGVPGVAQATGITTVPAAPRVIAAAGTTAAVPATPSVARTGPIQFYCPAAAGHKVFCGRIVTELRGYMFIRVTNHANYGEVCHVYAHGQGRSADLYINAGDSRWHHFNIIVPANRVVDLWCMRRAASGDAGIGGWFY